MPLAVSVTDVLLVIGLGAAGFLVVALVCAAVLALLQFILPSEDSGAAEIDHSAAEPRPPAHETSASDAEGDA